MIRFLTIRKFLHYFLFITAVLVSPLMFGQPAITQENDSLRPEEKGFFSIPEIDYEISKIDNYLNQTANTIIQLNKRLDHDTINQNLLLNIEKEHESFQLLQPEELSKFFLENSLRIWSGYESRLHSIQSEYYDLLKTRKLSVTTKPFSNKTD